MQTATAKKEAARTAADTTKPERPVDPYSTPIELEIGGIEVKGGLFSDPNAIIAVSGLSIGQKIKLPGEQISGAIRNLWKLKLFTDVRVDVDKKIGDILFLSIHVVERPRLSRYSYNGVKKALHEDINAKISRFLLKGSIVTEDAKTNSVNAINRYFIDNGYLDVKTEVQELKDSIMPNSSRIVFNVKSGSKVHIRRITFEGNENAKAGKLRKTMKETKQFIPVFTPGKFNKEEFEADKKMIIDYYNTIGLRDATIESDTVTRKGNFLNIKMKVNEGRRYYFRHVNFKGNAIYTSERLKEILGIEKGDVFDSQKLEQRLRFSQDGRDISSLYMDNGYLFFRVDPIETSIDKDSIDYELRIFEGPQATINNVTIKGNDRTHEHVIRRELRTKPGQKFSRSDIMRSQRELISLGYFNPEKFGVNTPVDAQKGTVDIEYTVEEKPSDQLELSAGWGGFNNAIIGTLGVTFNNFSLRNVNKPETWSPLPQGDGQKLSLRMQSTGGFYQSYNMSFTEPWLGGKKPNALSVSAFYTLQSRGVSGTESYSGLGILGGSIGIGTRLKKPDDYFVSQTSLNLQNIELNNWPGFAGITKGNFNNFSINQTFSRNSIDNPIFPTSGSRFLLSMQFTPPYSLFDNRTYDDLPANEKFKFLEYHKWKFTGEWFTPIGSSNKIVLRTAVKMGVLGSYNSKIGLSPFERFRLGGDGISGLGGGNQFLLGTDLIALRGYETEQIAANGSGTGAAMFNKFTAEMRYALTTNPSSTIYATTFLEGGNAWNNLKDYNPLNLYRTAGAGLRVFLPMFGTLGFDYGLGLDKQNLINSNAKVSDFGKFTIILGFEPE